MKTSFLKFLTFLETLNKPISSFYFFTPIKLLNNFTTPSAENKRMKNNTDGKTKHLNDRK